MVCNKIGASVLLARSENVCIEYIKTAPLVADIVVEDKLARNASVIV